MSNASIPELAHYGLAMSYDFSTRRTTAFVKGANAVVKDADSTYQPWTLDDRIRSRLHDSMPLWPHPLLLPAILLQHELAAIRNFSKQRLHGDSRGIQAVMRLDYEDQAKLLGGRNSDRAGRKDRADFTNGLNGLLCNAHSIRRALRVTRQAASFLLGILDELKVRTPQPGEQAIPPQVGQQIRDTIMTLDREAAGFEAGIDSIVATLEVQLNILSVVAAQLDNNRSAQMSAQAGLDSVAMKTLALVTAIFLPATFIATLFSMSMFDWQADSSSAAVSPGFWIFWVVSVPLSLAVLAAWWCFWDLSRSHYADRFKDADPTREHETLWSTLKTRMERARGLHFGNGAGRGEEQDMVDGAHNMNSRATLGHHVNKLVGRRPRRASEGASMESGGSRPRQQD
ncbi:hypothetical protein Daus18300_012590 [Diaporthe australafricana]|uniref:CorA-like Mg2+ transporter n=1 Tax=Diaporthe australafricana TaxID=127596 RepID=A0ABR3W227_9PEZI